MSDPAYTLVKQIFFAARGLPLSERAPFLAQRCGADEALRAEVESLLASDRSDEAFLDRLRGPVSPLEQALFDRVGGRIGEFEIERLLGEGGMAAVYLARQQRPLRSVALKVLLRQANDPLSRRRFEREIDALSRLQHPSIARIHSAGSVELRGVELPYYAMEYVEGLDLDAHCASHRPTPRARVELVLQICAAVEYAHAHGVVHRDLKPSNVRVDGDGRIKLLDFGVARLATDDSFATQTGQVIGTLAYMSPEQADGAVVDARTDVYSIGAMLYELLAARQPVVTRSLLVHEALRAIREQEPTPIGDARGGLSRDLETVVAKSLAKDRSERYSNVAELAHDLRAVLEHKPIRARAPSAAYQTVKLLRRRWLLFSSIAAVFVLLSAGLVFALRSLDRAVRAESVATRRRDAVLRLADAKLLEQLVAELPLLYPREPQTIPRYEAWLSEASSLVARLPEHEAFLRELSAASDWADLDPSLQRRSDWLLAEQSNLVERLREFDAPRDGAVTEIRTRLEFAGSLAARTVEDHADEWKLAAQRVAEDPRFRGLVLRPQVGLIPLGPDPRSGLEEFALFAQTGPAPVRDPEDHELRRGEDFGAVFVLVPGGACAIGTQGVDPQGPNFSSWSKFCPAPVELVELDPFLIGKYEFTKRQWLAATGEQPSYFAIGVHWGYGQSRGDDPVDSVNWFDCERVLGRLGLELPTEAQWEYAARGGTSGAWWTGDDPLSLDGIGNFPPELERLMPEHFESICLSDPYFSSCPAGALPPNPFGLHEVCGNVSEWCRDILCVNRQRFATRAGDGYRLVQIPDDDFRCHRGGNSVEHVGSAASYYRGNNPARASSSLVGVRASRRLAPPLEFTETVARPRGQRRSDP